MSRLAASFVLGYHGCDRTVADLIIAGQEPMRPSSKPYDWLGNGIYFWEADPQRALEWARGRTGRKKLANPAVVGAIIDLGECLDLMQRANLEMLRDAHEGLTQILAKDGRTLPVNVGTRRDLDCAVIEHLHTTILETKKAKVPIPQFDTARGLYLDGDEVYPGGSFMNKTHVQIAVRNKASIKGVFQPNYG